MKVLRRQELETNNIQVGDQITIRLTGFGNFTATIQKSTDKGVLFLFDECVAKRPMNEELSNRGGYDKSDLSEWIHTVLLAAFPEELRIKISEISVPTYGQMFGHDEWYIYTLEPDADKQLPLMRKRRNRVADFKDNYAWYWLQNAVKESLSAADFARVGAGGLASYDGASNSCGVRPVFWLVK